MYSYYARLVRAVDGDTYDLDVDLGFHLTSRLRVRLLGADAPEHREAGWAECTSFARTWFASYGQVVATTVKTDSFGRWLADITTDDGQHSLARELQALMDAHGWTSPDVRVTRE